MRLPCDRTFIGVVTYVLFSLFLTLVEGRFISPRTDAAANTTQISVPLDQNAKPADYRVIVTSVSGANVAPAPLLFTSFFVLVQLWQERTDRPITRSLKLQDFVYDAYTIKFTPMKSSILFSDAAWALDSIIDVSFRYSSSIWTDGWHLCNWELKQGTSVLARIDFEKTRRRIPTLRVRSNNATSTDIFLPEASEATMAATESNATLQAFSSVSADVDYQEGQIPQNEMLLLLRKVMSFWMKYTARTIADGVLPYGKLRRFQARGFQAAVQIVKPGVTGMTTKVADVVDGLLNLLVVLNREGSWRPFVAEISKPGRAVIAHIGIGSIPAESLQDTSSIVETT